ncbi:hypothetical protein BVRB_4g087310 [Beta vulgaris subsp. vulgaris]|nr:hypothetical protein BVRB_4g087310 [Beta vulgaris subsp. vulgaris]
MATFRAIGGKCRALMAAASSSATTAAKSATAKKPKRPSSSSPSATPPLKGFSKPIPVSPILSDFIGSPEASRTAAVKKVWEHIKLNNLQNPANKREIICDEKLKALFSGKDRVGFLEIAKLLSQHFVKTG